MEQVKLGEFNLKGIKSTEDQSTAYVLIQSFIKQLNQVVKQCFFYSRNKSDHLQLRPHVAIILQFLRSLKQSDIMESSRVEEFYNCTNRVQVRYELCLISKQCHLLQFQRQKFK